MSASAHGTRRGGHCDVPIQRARARLEALHGARCPCCGRITHKPSTLPGRKRHVDESRSKAHVFSVLHPRQPENGRALWFYACARCNYDQGALSLEEWALILEHRGDATRAAGVRAVVRVLREEGVL